MPYSPRWLVKAGKDEKAIKTLAFLRNLPADDELVQIEYLEIKAEALFEKRAFAIAFPNLAAKEEGSVWIREVAQYANCFRTKDNFKRVTMAWLVMFFQQWSGIDASKIDNPEFPHGLECLLMVVCSHLLCYECLRQPGTFVRHCCHACHRCDWSCVFHQHLASNGKSIP